MPSKIEFDFGDINNRRMGVWRYRELLPLANDIRPITMGEGGTPLIRLNRVGEALNINDIDAYVKFEGANPTGSFKDRGMTVGVTIARYIDAKGVIVASTGNTAASAAAYAARAGIKCIVVLPRGGVAKGKIAQALLHGAEVMELDGTFDDALEEVFINIINSNSRDLYPLNSYNPWRLEGQKSIAFEIVDELRKVPDAVIVPVGNAGNISAIWKGFKELYRYGLIRELPKMVGIQAEGAAPLVNTWRRDLDTLQFIEKPVTIASAIRIGKPVNWVKALKAVKESKGAFISVSDQEILESIKILARYEGIGVEPASATTLAGLIKAYNDGIVVKGDTVVLIATGHALKDPDTILNIAHKQV